MGSLLNRAEHRFAIRSVGELASRLGYSESELRTVSRAKRRYYRVRKDRDSSGKRRTFYIASGPLKKLLDSIKKRLLDQLPLADCLHGYRKGRSCLTNAKPHVGKRLVRKMDIKDFFPRIHFRKVETAFLALGCSHDVAKLLVYLCTCDYHLPHGFCTSPGISNLVINNFARRIQRVCDQYRIPLTMFSDDITISGCIEEDRFRTILDDHVVESIKVIAKQEGFLLHPSPRKNRKLSRKDRQHVTGITVNVKLNVPKPKRNELLSTLRSYQQGLVPLQDTSDPLRTQQSLRGKIAWAQSINPKFGRFLMLQYNKIDWPSFTLNSASHAHVP